MLWATVLALEPPANGRRSPMALSLAIACAKAFRSLDRDAMNGIVGPCAGGDRYLHFSQDGGTPPRVTIWWSLREDTCGWPIAKAGASITRLLRPKSTSRHDTVDSRTRSTSAGELARWFFHGLRLVLLHAPRVSMFGRGAAIVGGDAEPLTPRRAMSPTIQRAVGASSSLRWELWSAFGGPATFLTVAASVAVAALGLLPPALGRR